MDLRLPNLANDTVLNVAQLLKQPVGATHLQIHLQRLTLDEGQWARDVEANIRLTRFEAGILVDGEVAGVANVQCALLE